MTTTKAPSSWDIYLAALRHSGLVMDEVLKHAVQTYREQHPDAGENALELATALQKQGLVTDWQNEKLLQGKHRGFFLGKYKLLRHIGSGGMSRVFLAEHVRLKRRVAIKTLPSQRSNDPSYRDRFLLEARAIASLDHPNIVRAYDVSNDGTTYYMVIEYVEGQDLEKRVQQQGPLSALEAANYIRQVAEGLAHAHGRGMIHRDIKPANLLLDENGVVRILDMGLARLTNLEHSLTIEHNETVLGTADYLSPEQAINSHDVDPRTDIYSLGCSLYYLLVGHVPFPSGSLAQRLMKHQIEEPESIESQRDDVPEDLIAIWQRMVGKKPADRYRDAVELSAALAAFLESHGVAVPRTARSEGIRERPSTINMHLDQTAIDAEAEEDAASVEYGDDANGVSGNFDVEFTQESYTRSSASRRIAVALGGIAVVGALLVSLWWSGADAQGTPTAKLPLDQTIAASDLSFGNRNLLAFSIPQTGAYRLILDLKSTSPSHAMNVELDGIDLSTSGDPISLETLRQVDLGITELSAGRHQLALVFIQNPAASGNWYNFGPWRMIGAFTNSRDSSENTHPPESELAFDKTYTGKNNIPIRWEQQNLADGQSHSLRGLFQVSEWGICYLHRTITTTRDGVLEVNLSSDDHSRAWCNGAALEWTRGLGRGMPNGVNFQLPLKQGDNDLLIKIYQGSGGWAYHFAEVKESQQQISAPNLQYALHIEHQP